MMILKAQATVTLKHLLLRIGQSNQKSYFLNLRAPQM